MAVWLITFCPQRAQRLRFLLPILGCGILEPYAHWSCYEDDYSDCCSGRPSSFLTRVLDCAEKLSCGPCRRRIKIITEPLVDIAAFRNLVDPAEEEFLREQFTSFAFSFYSTRTSLAAVEYVQCAAGQARMLVRLVEGTRDQNTGELPQISEELATAAIRLRALSIVVLLSLYLRVAFPGLRISLVQIPTIYENVMGLGKLANVKRSSPCAHSRRIVFIPLSFSIPVW